MRCELPERSEEPPESPLTLADLDQLPVGRLRGVGAKRQEALASIGIESVLDLLFHYPRRYVDRSRELRVADVRPGDEAMVMAVIQKVHGRRIRGGRSLVEATVADETGSLRVTFFNQPWRSRQLTVGTTATFFGKVDSYRGQLQMTSPVVDLVGDRTGRIVPIYPQSEKVGLMTWELAGLIEEALRRAAPRGIADPLPARVRDELGLVGRHEAFDAIHRPESGDARMAARRRLVFDELLRVQLLLLRRKAELEGEVQGVPHVTDGPMLERFLAGLPFEPTAAQQAALEGIGRDLAAASPMHRLLQGDVGAGKTLVAVGALLAAVDGGHQGAFMAPTEVLAEQHGLAVRAFVDGLTVDDETVLGGRRPLRVELLTSRLSAARRREVLAALAEGGVDIAIGTHALIQEGVSFHSLGVVVVDEQHRFGVEQRAVLRDRGPEGRAPDVLVMTATPIPRSAAMTVYGDLDVTVLDEMPPGRIPVVTEWARTDLERTAVWARVRHEVTAGRQAYVVCPLIEDSEKLEVRSVTATYDELTAGELAGLRVGLLHGRLGPDDKETTMEMFRRGRLDVLVATTVIEVGVDVPNATAMVILSADRFGIAQLHQLRGRVGRGEHASVCFAVSDEEVTPDARERLEALVRTNDGFELAEVDLELRGEGTLFGGAQSGRNDLRLASLRTDRDWVERARHQAGALLAGDVALDAHPGLADELDWFVERLARDAAEGTEGADWLLKG